MVAVLGVEPVTDGLAPKARVAPQIDVEKNVPPALVVWRDRNGLVATPNIQDGIHLKMPGNRAMADLLAPCIARAAARPILETRRQ